MTPRNDISGLENIPSLPATKSLRQRVLPQAKLGKIHETSTKTIATHATSDNKFNFVWLLYWRNWSNSACFRVSLELVFVTWVFSLIVIDFLNDHDFKFLSSFWGVFPNRGNPTVCRPCRASNFTSDQSIPHLNWSLRVLRRRAEIRSHDFALGPPKGQIQKR